MNTTLLTPRSHHHVFPDMPALEQQHSHSIPIKKTEGPCANELEHELELELAEWRDLVLFHRITTGISKQQRQRQRQQYQQQQLHHHQNNPAGTNSRSRLISDMCLKSLIGTRNLTDDELNNKTHCNESTRNYNRRRRIHPLQALQADGLNHASGCSLSSSDVRAKLSLSKLCEPTSHSSNDSASSTTSTIHTNLQSMLLRSCGSNQGSRFYLSSHQIEPLRRSSIVDEEEAIFDLEL